MPDTQGADGTSAAGGMIATQNIGLIVVAAVVAVFLQVNGWLF